MSKALVNKLVATEAKIEQLRELESKIQNQLADELAKKHGIIVGNRYKVICSRHSRPAKVTVRGVSWVRWNNKNNDTIIVYCRVENRNGGVKHENYYVGGNLNAEFTPLEEEVSAL